MPNVLEYAKIFQNELDKQVVSLATSGWMELNSKLVRYNGGNEVKIPMMHMDGLGDYDRDKGYVPGSVSLEWQTKVLTQDRGRTFQLDRMDVDETNFVASSGAVMGEFQRAMVIPEIDAYRYSEIFQLGEIVPGVVSFGYDPDPATILTEIKKDIYEIYDVAGEIPLVINLSMTAAAILDNSGELTKQLSVIDFTQGDVKTKVNAIDTNPIIKVSSSRLRTKYDFLDGETSGEEQGGFLPAVDAKNINWIICPRNVPIAVSKTDNIRIFEPSTNQKADAWKLDYRKYHGLWIADNQVSKIRISVKEDTI